MYKCTLVKSVVELWSCSSVDLKDCAGKAFEWLNSSSSPSFQKDHVWPSVCRETERPWKFTIHTLGTKFSREEQDEMRNTFRKTLDCINGPVKLKDPTAQEFLAQWCRCGSCSLESRSPRRLALSPAAWKNLECDWAVANLSGGE